MANIQVTPELLQSKAAELRKLRASHDANMQSMSNLVRGLTEIWKGDAQTAFATKYESMQSTFKNFSELIEGYAGLMDNAAKQFSEADSALKSSMQGFGA